MKFLLLIFLLFLPHVVKAQNYKIKILDSSGNNVAPAYLSIYSDSAKQKLASFKIAPNGIFNIATSNNYYGQVASPGYYNYSFAFKSQLPNFSVTLIKNNVKADDIIVTAKQPDIIEKNDTTIFKLERFKDGTERKLNDILAKLPGIEVNKKSGNVTFKGKPINTILIEGDNLMDKNYQSLGKSLDVNLVKDVQAIENYNDNYILKDVSESKDVVLNLTLKKTKFKFNSDNEIGTGLKGNNKLVHNYNISSIGLWQKTKLFLVSKYNNIGDANSTFDFNAAAGIIKTENDVIKNIDNFIGSIKNASQIYANRTNNNSELTLNYNYLYKLSAKQTLRLNYYSLLNKITNANTSSAEYYSLTDTFLQSNNNNIAENYNLNFLKLNYRNAFSKTMLIEANAQLLTNQVNANIKGNNNFAAINFMQYAKKENSLNANIDITKRINKQLAYQLQTEVLNYTPLVHSIFNPPIYKIGTATANAQNTQLYQNSIIVNNNFFYRKDKFCIKVVFGFNATNINYKNNLAASTAINAPLVSSEKSLFKTQTFSNSFSFAKKIKKFNFNLISNLSIVTQADSSLRSVTNNAAITKFIAAPTLTIAYPISTKSRLTFSSNFSQKPIYESYIFKNGLLQFSRSLDFNAVGLEFVSEATNSFNYSYYDLYNHFNTSLGVNIAQTKGQTIATINFNDTIVNINNIFNAKTTTTQNYFGNIQKYLPILKTNFKLNTSYTNIEYYNLVNNSNLRLNILKNFNAELLLKTALKGVVNFQNNIIVNNTQNLPNRSKNLAQKFTKLQNEFSIFAKLKNGIRASLTSEFVMPNIKAQHLNYNFLDFKFTWLVQNWNMEIGTAVRNITNKTIYSNINLNDYFKSVETLQVLPRIFLVTVAFQL